MRRQLALLCLIGLSATVSVSAGSMRGEDRAVAPAESAATSPAAPREGAEFETPEEPPAMGDLEEEEEEPATDLDDDAGPGESALPTSALGMEGVDTAKEPAAEPALATGAGEPVVGTGVVETEVPAHVPADAFADPCEQHAACGECAADVRCGWCESTQRCSTGGLSGPKDAACLAVDWSFMYCRSGECKDYPTCSSCIADAMCGWCIDGETDESGQQKEACVNGDRRGPKASGTCPSGYVHTLSALGLHAAAQARTAFEHIQMLNDMCAAGGVLKTIETPPKPAPQPDKPIVVGIAPVSGPVFGRTVITITGAFFGASPTSGAVAYVGGKKCLETRWESSSVLKCTAPPSAKPEGPTLEDNAVTVKVGDLVSDPDATEMPYLEPGQEFKFGPRRFTYTTMRVRQCVPPRAPTLGGTIVVINGDNFGTRDMKPEASIGGKTCLFTQWLSEQQVKCVVAPGTGAQLNVKVSVLGFDSVGANNQLFSYDAPTIEAVRPRRGPTNGKMEITVYGRNFGPKDVHPTVNIGGVPCATTERVSHSTLKCSLPPGTGTGHRVGVTVPASLPHAAHSLQHRFTTEDHVTFSYLPPRITKVTPRHGPAKGRYVLRIQGRNFATGLPPAYASVNATDEGGRRLGRINRLVDEGNYDEALKDFAKAWMWAVDSPRHPLGAAASPAVELGITGANGVDAEGEVVGEERTVYCDHCRKSGCAHADCAQACPVTCTGRRGDAPVYEADTPLEEEAAYATDLGEEDETGLKAAMKEDEAAADVDVARGAAQAEREAAADRAAAAAAEAVGRMERGQPAAAEGPAAAGASMLRRRLLGLPGAGAAAAAASTNALRDALSGAGDVKPPAGDPEDPNAEAFGSGDNSAVLERVREAAAEMQAAQEAVAAHAASGATGGSTGASGATGGVDPEVEAAALGEGDEDVQAALEAAAARQRGEVLATPKRAAEPLLPCHPSAEDYTPYGLKCVRVMVGEHPCLFAHIVSENEIFCVVPPNVGTHKPIVVVTDGQTSLETEVTRFDYDPPVITKIHPDNGPCVGATTVTVHGRNFGTKNFAPLVTIGGTRCMVTAWQSDDAVECTLPYGMGADRSVVIEVGGQKSPEDKIFFDYNVPVVEGIHPTHGGTAGGYMVKVYGRNFGAEAHQPSAFIGDAPCDETKWVSDTLLLCRVPHGHGDKRSVRVVVADQENANNTMFSYDGPRVDRVEPNHCGTAGGCEVKVYGTNFGHMPHHSLRAKLRGRVERACEGLKWISNTEVHCRVPPGTGAGLDLQVSMGGQASPANSVWFYDPPVVESFTPRHAKPEGGSAVTINGKNFGTEDTQPLVAIGNQPCAPTVWVSDTSMLCRVPEQVGWNLTVWTEVDGQRSERVPRFDYAPPVITEVRPDHGSTEGGFKVEIHGMNFPPDTFSRLGKFDCLPFRRVSYDLLTCVVPEGIGANHSVEIFSGGRRYLQTPLNGSNWIVSVAAPVPRREKHPMGIGKDGDVVVGPDAANHTAPNETALAMFPAETGATGGASLPTGATGATGAKGADEKESRADAAGAKDADAEEDAEEEGGASSVLRKVKEESGVAVADADADSDSDSDSDSEEDEDAEMTLLELLSTAQSEGRLVRRAGPTAAEGEDADAAAGATGGAAAAVAVAATGGSAAAGKREPSRQFAVGDADIAEFWELRDAGARKSYIAIRAPAAALMNPKFSFDPPMVESLTPDHGVAAGGDEVIIKGFNFGPFGSHPVAYIDVDVGSDDFGKHVHRGMTACQRTKRLAHDTLECVTPAGVSAVRTTIVSVGGQNSSMVNKLWDYDAPEIESVEPDHGPPRGGYELKVWGVNFGTVKDNVTVMIGKNECENVTWHSDNLVTCDAPGGWGENRSVVIGPIGHDRPQKSERLPLFSYDPPEVFRVTPDEARVQGGAIVQIHGKNFGGKRNAVAPEASIGGVPCTRVVRVSHNVINCTVPPGIGRKLSVRVSLGTAHNGPNELFSYTVVDCEQTAWEDWSTCSAPCIGKGEWYGHNHTGGGAQNRFRVTVQPAENGGKQCGPVYEDRKCNDFPCPVDCKTTEWSVWDDCSQACSGKGAEFGHQHTGPGKRMRRRKVIRPAEAGGKVCPALNDTETCNTHACPVDCQMSDWGEWGRCEHDCIGHGPEFGHKWKGVPHQWRHRAVLREPEHGGVECGPKNVSRECPQVPNCPIDCNATGTYHWSTCSKPCDGGTQEETPDVHYLDRYGGKACPAPRASRQCNTQECNVDCKHVGYGPWGQCDLSTCSRMRSLNVEQATRGSGRACPPATEKGSCGRSCYYRDLQPAEENEFHKRCDGSRCPSYAKDGLKFRRSYAVSSMSWSSSMHREWGIEFKVFLSNDKAQPYFDIAQGSDSAWAEWAPKDNKRIRFGFDGRTNLRAYFKGGSDAVACPSVSPKWVTVKAELRKSFLKVEVEGCTRAIQISGHNIMPHTWKAHFGTHNWYWVGFKDFNVHQL